MDLGTAAPLTLQVADAANDPGGAYLALFANGTGTVDFDNLLVTGADGVTPPTVSFATATATAPEDAGTVEIPVTLDQTPTKPVTVDVAVLAGSATAADYTVTTGGLTFAAGQTTQNIALTLMDDGLIEGDEDLRLVLSNGSGLALGAITSLTFTIGDNDRPNNCAVSLQSLLPLWPGTPAPGRLEPVDVLDLIAENDCADCDRIR